MIDQTPCIRPVRRESQMTITRPRAFTLVELLVALTIASALTAVALPTLKDSLRQNALSRAASVVKGTFINARSNAIRSGRPYGVVIERRRGSIGDGVASGLQFLQANYATRMYYVQSPLEYRGDVNESAAIPQLTPTYDPLTPSPTTFPVNYTPFFFVPIESSGLLYAAATARQAGTSSPALRLVDIGTRFSVNDLDYVFQVTNLTTQAAPLGTIIEFDFRTSSTLHGLTPSENLDNVPSIAFVPKFPGGLEIGTPYSFKFRTNPIRAPLAPVSLLGKSVIDLSVSGTGADPVAFNSQAILDPDPTTTIPPLAVDQELNDIVVMFAPDGRLDGIYYDQRFTNTAGTAITGFGLQRVDPASSVGFNVGFVDGILDNIDDGARFPDVLNNTDFQINTDDPPLDPTPAGQPITPTRVPNYANTDCAWISIQPLSGAISLTGVAGQPPAQTLINYYGFGANPPARQIIRARVHQSRRLTSGGTVQ